VQLKNEVKIYTNLSHIKAESKLSLLYFLLWATFIPATNQFSTE